MIGGARMRSMRGRAAAWLDSLPTAVRLTMALAVVVNLFLGAGYLWSRQGQTTSVRFEVRGQQFTAYVDGRQQLAAELDAPPQGGVLLAVEDTSALPSLPQPSGIDGVRVTDLDTGEVLFSDDFSVAPPESALVKPLSAAASLRVRDGVLEATDAPDVPGSTFAQAYMRIDGPEWRNYAVDVRYRNLTSAGIRVRSSGDGDGVQYDFRPFRHVDQRMFVMANGKQVLDRTAPALETDTLETVRGMVRLVLRPYPLLLLLLVVLLAVVALVQFAPEVPFPSQAAATGPRRSILLYAPWAAVAALATAAFGFLLFYNYSYGSHMPHVPDELSYIFQAKLLAAGHLAAPPPPVPRSFEIGNPPLTVIRDGKWASLYPFGHPLMLAIGVRIGAIWLIPPLVGALSIVLVFAIGRRIYNLRTGMLAAGLFAVSPFFLMTASNFMSHNTATFYLLLSILFLAHADRRPLLFPALAGIFFGLVFNTRQLSGAALVVPFGVLLLTLPFGPGRRRLGISQIAAFACGALTMLLAYFLYRYGTAGDVLATMGIQTGKDQMGFGGAHSVAAGVAHERTQLTYLVMMLSNWPVAVGFLFVLLPFVLGSRSRWDWFFLIAIVFLWGIYTVYYVDGFMHGPRFWYETTPLLLLLTARGADLAAEYAARAAAGVRRAVGGRGSLRRWPAVAIVYIFVGVLAVTGWRSWAFGSGADWGADFAPARAKDLRGFNGISDALISKIDEAKPRNALVLVEDCDGWQCYGNVDWRNSPWLDGDVVFAKDLPDRNVQLLQAFPDRYVYFARYLGGPLFLPFAGYDGDRSQLRAGDPQKAGSFPTPAPTAIPTPTPIDPLQLRARDERREQIVAELVADLQRYREERGAYPITANPQSLCVYPQDAGCSLKDVVGALPEDPLPERNFSYQSVDGTSFTIYARFEGAAPPSVCPDPLPENVTKDEHLFCATGP